MPPSDAGYAHGAGEGASAIASATGDVNPARLQPPASPYVVQAGAVIPAALVTGLRSDLPGQVIAQVTQNLYDSLTGRILLAPQGSKLIGTYDSYTQDPSQIIIRDGEFQVEKKKAPVTRKPSAAHKPASTPAAKTKSTTKATS